LYSGKQAWKAIGDRLKRPHYLSRIDHERKIRIRAQRTDKGKYCEKDHPTLELATCRRVRHSSLQITYFRKEDKASDNRGELKENNVFWKSSKSIEKRNEVKII